MTKPLSVSEARDKLAEVIGQVQYGGERVTISRRGKPVAVVVSVADAAWLEAMEDQIDVKLALEAKAEMEALGGEDVHARRGHGGTGRRQGIGRGLDRHAGPGGAQVAQGDPGHAPAWADRPGAPGAGRGAAAVRGEAAGGLGRNAADPGGGLADPL